MDKMTITKKRGRPNLGRDYRVHVVISKEEHEKLLAEYAEKFNENDPSLNVLVRRLIGLAR